MYTPKDVIKQFLRNDEKYRDENGLVLDEKSVIKLILAHEFSHVFLSHTSSYPADNTAEEELEAFYGAWLLLQRCEYRYIKNKKHSIYIGATNKWKHYIKTLYKLYHDDDNEKYPYANIIDSIFEEVN